jgi:predicted RNase H-like nuclease (RuvC/YqgF family)
MFLAIQRRRAQNRAAQRAFRLRKEETIKVISAKLSKMEGETEWMKQSNQDLSDQVSALQRHIKMLEKENRELKEASLSESFHRSTPIGRAFLIPETDYLEEAW